MAKKVLGSSKEEAGKPSGVAVDVDPNTEDQLLLARDVEVLDEGAGAEGVDDPGESAFTFPPPEPPGRLMMDDDHTVDNDGTLIAKEPRADESRSKSGEISKAVQVGVTGGGIASEHVEYRASEEEEEGVSDPLSVSHFNNNGGVSPPPFDMPTTSATPTDEDTEDSVTETVPSRRIPAQPHQEPRRTSSPWFTRTLAVVAGLFGVHAGVEQTIKTGKEVAHASEVAQRTFTDYVGSRYAQAAYAVPETSPHDAQAPQKEQPRLHTYTLTPNDTLWGIATNLVETLGVEDPSGILALEAVKALREANDIHGNPATSKKMWVGKTLDTTAAYNLVVSRLPTQPESVIPHITPPPSRSKTNTAEATPNTPQNLADIFPAELLSPSLNHRGETVWLRTQSLLESLGVKPNLAKRSVLTAIVLADSGMSETQAMRINYQGDKKYTPKKDALNFTRAAQAALDLKNGVSPGDVAKKYGVKNQYEKLRDR